ncbi:MAG TPA: efflux RND transporter permease subunit [Acidobacteriota bacterium]|nr:efflux RND transporter permease subunit [Acidobacteriota bacterium]
MIDLLIRTSLNNRGIVIALALALLIWGGYVAGTAKVDVFPDLTAPTVTILVEGRGMVPTEMESLVTFPIEASMNGASGVRRVRSATTVGMAIIWVEFNWGVDIHRARQVVSEKLALTAGSLPPGVEPVIAPISSIMGEILFLALKSDMHSPMELRTTAETVLHRRLMAVPGVSQVTLIGGSEKQYQILLKPAQMHIHNISLQEVESALQEANRNASAGFVLRGGEEIIMQGIGRVSTPEEIASIPVAVRGGRPVTIGQIATAQIGEAVKRGEGSYNGRPAVILGVQKQPGANTLELTKELDLVLDDIQAALPENMRISKNIFRQADFIEVAVKNIIAALRDGGLLVILIVVMFLANIRAASITLLALPLSILSAVVILHHFGITVNTMTLGGLAIAIGALVDDAIIDVENVSRRLRLNAMKPEAERLPSLEVVYTASREIRSSIVYATIIIAIVFLPLFFLSGLEGRLLQPLGLAYLCALVASTLVALTVTPVLCSLFLPGSKGVLRDRDAWLVRILKRMYRPALEKAIDHPWLVIAASLALLLGAILGLMGVGRAFLPPFNEGRLTISAVTLPGTNLAQSDRLGRWIEEILLTVPEVTGTARRTGRAELDEHVQGVESAEIDVGLKMRDRSKDEMLRDIRDRLSQVPGMNFDIGQPISHRIDHMLSGTRSNIAVKIFGDDLATLRDLAGKARTAMSGVPGVVDLNVEAQAMIPMLRIRFNQEALSQYGMSSGQAAEAVEIAFSGKRVGQVLDGRIAFDMVLRYGDEVRESIQTVGDTLISTPTGARVPLKALADLREDRGPNYIAREAVQRRIVISCNVAERSLVDVVDDIRHRIGESVQFPPGYHIEYGGQFESAIAASRILTVLGIVAFTAILGLLIVAFRSTADAAIVMLNLPLALIGGVAGVFAGGGVLSIAGMIGFIALFGIAVRNGILLITHIRHLKDEEGVTDRREAVVRGALERLAPILMTALTASLALLPLALGAGKPGNEIQAPMALVIMYGLFSSTFLNMVVLPTIYLRFRRN